MNKFCLLLLSMLSISGAMAQLVNNGATITIMPGATLYVETNVINNTGGTITVQGNLEVTGNLTNNATITTTSNSLVKFSGAGDSEFKSNNADIHNLELDKTTGNVLLVDDLKVLTNLNFDGGRLALGDNELFLGDATTVTGANSTSYIATNGEGRARKALSTNATVNLPLGDMTNYSPLSIEVSGSAYASAYLRARVEDAVHPELPADADDHISRYWQIQQSGITDYNGNYTGTFVPADVAGTPANIKGAAYDTDGMVWSYINAAGTANTVSGTITNSNEDVTGSNFYGSVLLKAFLSGAYNATTGAMTTSLNTLNLIPTTSPYNDAPASVSAIPANVTDWVKLEIRDASNPATVLSRVSAFVKNNGEIVGLDGVRPPAIKNAPNTGHVSIHHRNHLPIRTPAALNMVSPTIHDFSTAQAQAYQNGSITTNAAMREVTGANPAFCLWGGNSNGNTNIRYTGLNNDNGPLISFLGGNTLGIINNVYSVVDLNLNGNVRYTGLNNDNAVLISTLNGNTLAVFTQHL